MIQDGFVPYFEPLYPGVVYRCQLCGSTISTDEYVTREARQTRARQAQGEYIFCMSCSPYLDELTQHLAAEGAKLDALHEKFKRDQLEILARGLLENLQAQRSGGATGAPKPGMAPAAAPPTPAMRPQWRPTPGVSIPVPE